MADVTLSAISTSAPSNRPDTLDGQVLTIANAALGNADTSYFYFGLVKDGYNIFSLQFTIQATTLTMEASNSPASTADSSATWTDVTDVLTSGVATSFTTTGSLTRELPFPWSRMRVKRVTTNATNALTLILTRGRVN